MGKPIKEVKYYHGLTEVVESQHNQFVYEVSLYELSRDSASCIGSTWYYSYALLSIKETTIVKRKGRMWTRYITLISAPKDFIVNNNLQVVTSENRRKRSNTDKQRRVK